MSSPQNDPYEAEVEQPDKDPVPGLGDPDDEDTDGVVCMPADLVKE